MALTKARIGVLMGGCSAERTISLKTGMAVYGALIRRGYRAVCVDVDASLPWQLRTKKVEVAFLALHGPGGEDGTVQGLLEVLGIPYTGSGVRASALAMDKPITKALWESQGIPVPKGTVLRAGRKGHLPPPGMKWPLVVKPAAQGSTVGVTIVRRSSDWRGALRRAFDQGPEVLVETFIAGREIAVSVLDGAALPPVEVVAPGGFYDFAAKYEKAETRYLCPAPLSRIQANRLENLAMKSYRLLGCEGAARVDFRLNRLGRPFVLEINTIPGMTERSLLPMAASQAGIDYDTLTERILESGLSRNVSAFKRKTVLQHRRGN